MSGYHPRMFSKEHPDNLGSVESNANAALKRTNQVLKESFLLEVRWYRPLIRVLTDKRSDFLFVKKGKR